MRIVGTRYDPDQRFEISPNLRKQPILAYKVGSRIPGKILGAFFGAKSYFLLSGMAIPENCSQMEAGKITLFFLSGIALHIHSPPHVSVSYASMPFPVGKWFYNGAVFRGYSLNNGIS